MTTCIIIDDERRSRETLKKIIDRFLSDKITVVGMAETVKEGVYLIKEKEPALVFLDIEMPNESGFKLFEYFDDINFEIVFTTAYRQYAIDAFKYSAIDYLLKPINYLDLEETINRVETKRRSNTKDLRAKTLVNNLKSTAESFNKIALPTLEGYQLEKVTNIVYCEADENYTKLYTIQGTSILVTKTLKAMEELLQIDIFFRIHKSYLVNLNYIKSYSKTEGYRVTLENGVVLDVATRRNEAFIKALTKQQ